jgi:hypothetical protein
MLTGARKVAEKNAGTSGAFADVAAALKKFLEAEISSQSDYGTHHHSIPI